MTDRQQKFVECYLVCLNAAQAAREAGYSEKVANREGHRLLKLPYIQAAIAAGIEARKKRVEVQQDDVLRELLAVMLVDPGNAMSADGKLLPLHPVTQPDGTTQRMPETIRRAVASIEVEELFETVGTGEDRVRVQTGVLRKVKFHDKVRAIDLGMRHLGLIKTALDLKLQNKAGDALIIEIRRSPPAAEAAPALPAAPPTTP